MDLGSTNGTFLNVRKFDPFMCIPCIASFKEFFENKSKIESCLEHVAHPITQLFFLVLTYSYSRIEIGMFWYRSSLSFTSNGLSVQVLCSLTVI